MRFVILVAAGAANFTHAFVQAPICVPSRASFFTGRYPHAHRNRVNYTPLSRREILLQARLKEAGYVTAAVGKLHLHPPTVQEARRSGFDFVELHDGVSFLDRFPDYAQWRKQHDPQADLPYRSRVHRTLRPAERPGRNPKPARPGRVRGSRANDEESIAQVACHSWGNRSDRPEMAGARGKMKEGVQGESAGVRPKVYV